MFTHFVARFRPTASFQNVTLYESYTVVPTTSYAGAARPPAPVLSVRQIQQQQQQQPPHRLQYSDRRRHLCTLL